MCLAAKLGWLSPRIKRAGAAEVETANPSRPCCNAVTSFWPSHAQGPRKIPGRHRQGKRRELAKAPGRVISRRLLSRTRKSWANPLDELDLDDVHGVAVTRINRADIEMTAIPALRIPVCRRPAGVRRRAGLSRGCQNDGQPVFKTLNETNFHPRFLSASLLVSSSVRCPSTSPTCRFLCALGIAGGPLVLAIFSAG